MEKQNSSLKVYAMRDAQGNMILLNPAVVAGLGLYFQPGIIVGTTRAWSAELECYVYLVDATDFLTDMAAPSII